MCNCSCQKTGFKRKEARTVARDPVCGKKIDCEGRDALKLSHEKSVYFFCSTRCMTAFMSDPGKYQDKKQNFFGLFHKG